VNVNHRALDFVHLYACGSRKLIRSSKQKRTRAPDAQNVVVVLVLLLLLLLLLLLSLLILFFTSVIIIMIQLLELMQKKWGSHVLRVLSTIALNGGGHMSLGCSQKLPKNSWGRMSLGCSKQNWVFCYYATFLRLRRECHIQNLLEQIAICTNPYQHRMLFDLFQTSSKCWLTWVGVACMSLGCFQKLQRRWGLHVLRVLSKIELCVLAPDFFIINFRLPCLPWGWEALTRREARRITSQLVRPRPHVNPTEHSK
jgi:hypothetical protein